MVQCFEVECNHASEKQTCSFFRIPSNQKLRLNWQIVFDRRKDKKWTPHSRLCSCHFLDGKKENGPTIFNSTNNVSFKKKSAKDLTESRNRFINSILGAKGPIRHTPNPMAIQRLNPPAMKSHILPNKRQQLSENGQNLFSHLQMNFASNINTKCQGLKRPAPVSLARAELEDIKPCKRQLDAQKSIQMEHNRSQVTTNHHGYPHVTSAQQNHLQLPTSRQNPLQMSTSHQSSTMAQSQQSHSQITIVSQNHHHTTTGQLNHQVSVSQHNYSKANSTGHPNPFQVPTSQQGHPISTGPKNHQNVTLGHSKPLQVTTNQPMITEQQNQPQINVGHQKRQQLSPAQLRFLETGPARTNRIEGATNQQQNETLQEPKKTVAEVPSRHLKQSSSSDVTGLNSVSKLNSVPQMTKKTFTVSKHQHTVMSSLASLWKDSKLCDATIGNGNFKIMVHKVVLLAISPKLLSQANIKANCFIRVNLPEEVSQSALVAFSEYMYHGVLTLDPILLQQLRIIALQLGIRELELLCDTHLLYCDLQNSVVDSGLTSPETCPSSFLALPAEASTSTGTNQRVTAEVEFKTVKQEGICEEVTSNSSLKNFTLPVKKEPIDQTSNCSAEIVLNASPSPNVNNDLRNRNYKPNNLEEPVLFGPYNNEAFHSQPPDFDLLTTPLRQAAPDCLLELNDILQLQKFFKKSDLPNFNPSDCLDKSTLSLNHCVSQNNEVADSNSATSTDNPLRPDCGDQSKKHSEGTSQPLEVLKETTELLTFQITDIRSVQQTIDIT